LPDGAIPTAVSVAPQAVPKDRAGFLGPLVLQQEENDPEDIADRPMHALPSPSLDLHHGRLER
jgi:hypothetical protein